MIVILIIIFVIVLARFPMLRYTLFHLPTVSYNAGKDLISYIRCREWNSFTSYGEMQIYIASPDKPFGSGKTLNMVADTINIYNQYNNKQLYDKNCGEWVTQYIHIISNIELYSVPYIPLESTSQITDIVNLEYINNDHHIFIFLIDELGSIFNNRDWKNNLPSDLLGAILQQRKNKILIKGTVQDFSLFDATLRKLSSKVYQCEKTWRFLQRTVYLASDLETSGFNSGLVKSRGSYCGFATDKLYASYNTNEVVKNMQRTVIEGKHLTSQEIIASSSNTPLLEAIPRKHRSRKRKAV